MARNRYRRCLGVDLGKDTVKIVELVLNKQKDRTTLVVQNACQAQIEAPHDAPEEVRRDAAVRAVKDLIRSNRIQTKTAIFSLAGQSVFNRKITLPATSEGRLERIIRFEARQKIPFPLDQTEIKWQIFNNEDDSEYVDVMLVAIRKDLVAEFMRTVNRCGLTPVGVSVSALDLYNGKVFMDRGLQLDEPPKKKKKKKKKKAVEGENLEESLDESMDSEMTESEPDDDDFDDFEEVKAYMNIGAETFDLAIRRQGSKKDMLGFTRSVPFAGNELTRAIMENCGIASFGDADDIKKSRVKVLTPGFDEDDDEGGQYDLDACRAIKKPVNRIVSELRRSLDFYISQPDGVSVDTIEISGGQASLPNFASHIEDKLGLPVITSETIAESDFLEFREDPPADFNTYLIAFGQAVQGMGLAQLDVNFLPRDSQVALDVKKKYLVMGVMAVIIGVMVFISASVGGPSVRAYRDAAQRIENRTATLSDTAKTLADAVERRAQVAQKFDSLGRVIAPVPDQWFIIYSALIEERPAAIYLESVEFNAFGDVRITGLAKSLSDIPAYTTILQNSEEIKKYFKPNARGDYASIPEYREGRHAILESVTEFELVMRLKFAFTRWQPEEMSPFVEKTGPSVGGANPGGPGVRGGGPGRPDGSGVRGGGAGRPGGGGSAVRGGAEPAPPRRELRGG